MEVNTKKDIVCFVDNFFENHPTIKMDGECDKIEVIHDLLAFGMDCMAIGREEGFTAGQNNIFESLCF